MITNTFSRLSNTLPRARRFGAWQLSTFVLLFGGGLAMATGCADDFDPPSLVARTRVLGARVEVSGAPERATPTPGEEATVTWLVTSPGAPPAVGWAFVLCAADPLGGLGCGGPPLAKAVGATSPPRLTFAAPGTAGATLTRFTVFGYVCVDDDPIVDARGVPTGCGGDARQTGGPTPERAARETAVSAPVWVADAAHTNRNPATEGALTFDGAAWAAQGSAGDACVLGPRVAAGSKKHELGLTVAETDRETYDVLQGDPPRPSATRETLELSLFATSGKMRTPFLFLEGEDTTVAPTAATTWDAPAAEDLPAGDGDIAVAFTFVLRDGRGGTSWTTRSLCVTR